MKLAKICLLRNRHGPHKSGRYYIAAKRQIDRPAMRQQRKLLHTVMHPEDFLLAFTCPALLTLYRVGFIVRSYVKLTMSVSIFRGSYRAGIAMLQPK